ncbi:MAG: Smr/MutS family protein, partial [Candidatus Binatales bacterium]
MPRKRQPNRHQPKRPKTPKPVFASPFKALKKLLQEKPLKDGEEAAPRDTRATDRPAPPATIERPEPDEATLLAQALEGVRPLDGVGRTRIPLDPEIKRAIVSEDSEVLAQLSDLVSGQAPFDITQTDEYVEGARAGIDPRLVTRVRRGEFAVQGHIDLHGKTESAAKEALTAFITDSVRKGLRMVLVVHGRGLRSPGGHPVLKRATVNWLSQSALAGYVLAFATARPTDGGAGATYVLLRRERRRSPFEVLQGAK